MFLTFRADNPEHLLSEWPRLAFADACRWFRQKLSVRVNLGFEKLVQGLEAGKFSPSVSVFTLLTSGTEE